MSKKLSVFARLLILVMCLALVFCGCKKADDSDSNSNNNGGSGNSAAGEAIDKTFDDVLGGDVGEVIGDALACGKITITVGDMVENVLYINSDAGKFADELYLNIDGQEIKASLFGDNGELALSIPALLGDTAYGINLNTLVSDLESSPIWSMLGMSYQDFVTMSGIDLGEVMDSLENVTGSLEGIGTLLDEILSNIDVTTTEGKVTVNGTEVDATIITYSFDEQDVLKMANAALDGVKEMAEDMVNELAGSLGDYIDVDEILGEMDFEDLKAEMQDAFEEVELDFSLSMNINASTGYLMSVNGEMAGVIDGDEGRVYLDLVLGVDPSASDKYTFEVGAEGDVHKSGLRAVIERDLDSTVQVTTLTVSAFEDDEEYEMMTGSLEYNTSTHDFELVAEASGEELVVTGSFQSTDDLFELGIDSVEVAGDETVVDLLIRIEAINGSQIPDMPSYKNILKLTAEEIEELVGMFGGGSDYDDYYGEEW